MIGKRKKPIVQKESESQEESSDESDLGCNLMMKRISKFKSKEEEKQKQSI